jgi:hypothetical protein
VRRDFRYQFTQKLQLLRRQLTIENQAAPAAPQPSPPAAPQAAAPAAPKANPPDRPAAPKQ